MHPITIRPAKYEDRFALARLILDATYSAFRGRVPDQCLEWLTVEESATNWGRNFENGRLLPGKHLFVAEVARADIIGLAMVVKRSLEAAERLKIAQDYAWDLVSLQVDPAWQRRGIGRNLVAQVAKLLVRKGESRLMVRVLADNPNLEFYLALGAILVDSVPYDWEGYRTQEFVFGWANLRTLK